VCTPPTVRVTWFCGGNPLVIAILARPSITH
jgi:hypothetical protein